MQGPQDVAQRRELFYGGRYLAGQFAGNSREGWVAACIRLTLVAGLGTDIALVPLV